MKGRNKMAILYEIQPDDLEPIEFTHFDQWFCDEKEDGTQEQYATRANEILKAWEQTLNIKLPRPNFAKDGLSLGFEIVCEAIVNAGFSVYNGDEFIEIYNKADSNTRTYSVIKVVGYAYTVEASSREEAEEIVEEYGSVEADDIYTDSIDATLIGGK